MEQEKLFNKHEQNWIRLEQRLGFSMSETSAFSVAPSNQPVASTSGTNPQQHRIKRSLQGIYFHGKVTRYLLTWIS